jgi:hypothetical protein
MLAQPIKTDLQGRRVNVKGEQQYQSKQNAK